VESLEKFLSKSTLVRHCRRQLCRASWSEYFQGAVAVVYAYSGIDFLGLRESFKDLGSRRGNRMFSQDNSAICLSGDFHDSTSIIIPKASPL
jgi:hypothetical protein